MAQTKSTIRKIVELNTEDTEWFEKTYPQGSYSWLLSMLLREFRKASTQTPQDYARIAAEELEQQLEG